MSEYISNSIFITPREGYSLPLGFREKFLDEQGEFTYAKTRPAEPFDEGLDWTTVGDVSDGTLTINLDTLTVPDAWLCHLAREYPSLIIECEYSDLDEEVFGRDVWSGGQRILSQEVDADEWSFQRLGYFGYEIEDNGAVDTFEDEENAQAVQEVQTALEGKDWVALMDALFTARHQLKYFEGEDIGEDELRVAIVANAAAIKLLHAVLTDPSVDAEPIAGVIGYCDEDCRDGRPDVPATRDDLLEVVETIAVESARLVSLSRLHATAREIRSLKERAVTA
jgi:hypothetical protein